MALAKRTYTAERQAPRDDRSRDVVGATGEPTNRDLMDAIAGLAAELRDRGTAPSDAEFLRNEVRHLATCIERAKAEIADIRHQGMAEDRLHSATGELDAIVAATEQATHGILAAAEQINELCECLRIVAVEQPGAAAVEGILAQVVAIFESCNFQDITGQRISKVVGTLQHIDARVSAMVAIWGEQDIAEVATRAEPEAPADAEAALLNGPQREGAGISQADIDALFS